MKMILICKIFFQKVIIFHEQGGKFKILKKRLSISGCHGNVKFAGQGLDIPNCSQIK